MGDHGKLWLFFVSIAALEGFAPRKRNVPRFCGTGRSREAGFSGCGQRGEGSGKDGILWLRKTES
nr:MAG TPA: hypothetical protein [Caudoviricetes sp.]